MAYLSQAEDFQGVADVFLRTPTLYAPLLKFIEAVMIGPSRLTKAEREVIAAHVSVLNECGFCLGAHRATLKAMGVVAATVDTLEQGTEMAGISDRMRALLVYAEKLTRTPEAVDGDDIETLRAAGWSDQTIEDAINVIALFSYVNRLVDAFGIVGSPAYFDHIGQTLASQGYAPLLRQAAKLSAGQRGKAAVQPLSNAGVA